MTRRTFLTTTAALAAGSQYLSAQEAILSRVKAPTFANRDFDITKYGAVADGAKDCTDAIRKAIAACTKAGGGRVVVPSGVFLTGAVHLDNNVNLHVSEGERRQVIAERINPCRGRLFLILLQECLGLIVRQP